MIPDLLTPIGLGLIGFLEPCSLGANAIFLSYVAPLSGWRRVGEALTFTLSRGVFLGLIGAVAGAAGGAVLALQRWYITTLGIVFVLLGLLVLTGGSRYLPRLPSLGVGHLHRVRSVALLLGVIFGLSAPVCAMPLLGALVARSLPLGAVGGFVEMFVFGVAMSAPLIGLTAWRSWQHGLQRLNALQPYAPYLTGGGLILIGVYGITSGWRW
jgi:cytochrome c-type biogenesis protein